MPYTCPTGRCTEKCYCCSGCADLHLDVLAARMTRLEDSLEALEAELNGRPLLTVADVL